MWLLQAWQCLFFVVLVFAILGFMRGWRREILSVAFILAGVLVVGVGGGQSGGTNDLCAHTVGFSVPGIICKSRLHPIRLRLL